MLNDNGRNASCDGVAAVVTHLSLHSTDPGTTGVGELTGGSPAYARLPVTWGAASGGQRSNTGALAFNVPPGTTVNYVGLWSADTGGTNYGYVGSGNTTPLVATMPAATDVFTSYAHGLTLGQTVLVADIMAVGLPAAFVEGTIYFVVAPTADTFQLSATSGGAAINAATDTELAVQRVIGETYSGQGTYTVAVGAAVLDGRFV